MNARDDWARFKSHLEASRTAVWLVARYFQERGYTAEVPPIVAAPTHDEWREYVDEGDLFISKRDDYATRRYRVEVKHSSRDFTCAEDWPFRPRFIVCACHAWDKAKPPKPFWFFIVNRACTHVAIVRGCNHDHWKVERITDARYSDGRNQQDCYLSPMEHIEWRRLDEPPGTV